MKNKKLSKLAIVASSAMLLAGCKDNFTASLDMQRAAIQNKLEQMGPEADAYIREKMAGRENYYDCPLCKAHDIDEGPFLDLWAKNDTNGTFVDEYVDLAMTDRYYYVLEGDVRSKAIKAYKADQKKAKLQQKIDKIQNQINHSEELTK